jgi:hypothetical protein
MAIIASMTVCLAERSQSLVNAVVERTADWLVSYAALDQKRQKAAQSDLKIYAKCLDYACASLFYASGAFPERNMPNSSPIRSDAESIFLH